MNPTSEFLDTGELARRLGVKPQTVRCWRLRGGGRGPKFVKFGGSLGRCRYNWQDVLAWLDQCTHESTAELRATPPVHRGRKPGSQNGEANELKEGGPDAR
ncbi:MAG: helix-turn-helix domain-containing protein [Acidobacteria bacterium]|nr:helix-turn-helix domain-containing protein [Acidobacteriota bacterium]